MALSSTRFRPVSDRGEPEIAPSDVRSTATCPMPKSRSRRFSSRDTRLSAGISQGTSTDSPASSRLTEFSTGGEPGRSVNSSGSRYSTESRPRRMTDAAAVRSSIRSMFALSRATASPIRRPPAAATDPTANAASRLQSRGGTPASRR
ncbi:hypothetical protein D8S78_03475 [Natrialba swarupiae]|nr:hypothetical protein [Natrialba swarupiae]